MSTIAEVIQRVQSLYSKGVHSDDTRLSSRHIYNVLNAIRIRLIYQKVNKNKALSEWYFKTLPCVELEDVSVQQCIDLGCADLDCTIKKTKCPLPEPIFGKEEYSIMSVTTLDNSIQINPVSSQNIKYLSFNKYTANTPGYYWENKYMYFVNLPEAVNKVKIKGIWLTDTDVFNFCPDGLEPFNNDCVSILDTEFSIDGELEEVMVEIAIKELVGMFSQVKDDKTNNTSDDNKGNV
jgi:hypothetical protein